MSSSRLSEINDTWRQVRENNPTECMFVDQCDQQAINAHSVPRSTLLKIGTHGLVMQPVVRMRKDDGTGQPRIGLQFRPTGTKVASVSTFACRNHDHKFLAIDSTRIDMEDSTIQNWLSYRAVLREIQTLQKIRPVTKYVDRVLPGLQYPTSHPDTRLKSLVLLRQVLGASLGVRRSPGTNHSVTHSVRRIRSHRPIIAASCASGGSMMAQNEPGGVSMSDDDFRSSFGVEPYTCWTLVIVPQEDCHAVLFSWLTGSVAESYFSHLNKVQGGELEAAVSAELILFGENWFLSPQAWLGYGIRKQEAILKAYDNFQETHEGKYSWWDKDPRIPWYEYLGIPNRHQINLLQYDESVFQREVARKITSPLYIP